jgi:flagellar hook-length control protein FliK
MNTAAAIYENLVTTMPRENAGRGKAATEAFGDSSQQRFSDMLPVAQAAQASKDQTPEETSGDAAVATVEVTADPVLRKETPAEEEADVAYSQVVGWPFAELIPPAGPSQNQEASAVTQAIGDTMEEQTTGSPAFGAEGLEQALSAALPRSETTDPALAVPQTPQANGTGQPQAVSSQGLPGESSVVTDVTIPDEKTAGLAAAGADEQASTAPEVSQEATPAPAGAASKTPSNDVQAEGADVQGELTSDGSGPETAGPVSRHKAQDAMASDARESDGSSDGRAPKVEPDSVKGQSTSPQADGDSASQSKSKTGAHDPGTATQNWDGDTLETEIAAPENPKISQDPVGGKDAPIAVSKETGTEGTAAPELRVSTVGETSASSHRMGSQTQTQSQTTTQTSSPQTPVQSVGEQILDSVRASMTNGDRQVSIRLLPPELGTVVVRFQERGDQLTGVVEVANGDTRREVERAMPQVVRSLQEAGVQVRRVEVVTADQPDNRNPGQDNLSQDVWQQHQGTGQNREHAYASQQTRWSQNLGGRSIARSEVSSEPSHAASQGRIDLLL